MDGQVRREESNAEFHFSFVGRGAACSFGFECCSCALQGREGQVREVPETSSGEGHQGGSSEGNQGSCGEGRQVPGHQGQIREVRHAWSQARLTVFRSD
jgi:hypothetical protein